MKKLALILCSIMVISFNFLPVYASDIIKDETVYAQLDYTGKLQDQQVVNHLFTKEKSTKFSDMTYSEDVFNLTDLTEPIKNNKTVEWNLSEPTSDFYYQSSSKEALPYVLDIAYTLNNSEITGAELAGKTGKVTIDLSIKPNEQSNVIYRENMMAQISMNLESDHAMNIIAPEATKVVAGKLTTLNYVVFAKQSGDYQITLDASEFQMEGITISIIPSGFSLPDNMEEQLDEMTNGFSDMEDAMGEMVDGTQKLKNGMSDLSGGVHGLNTGYQTFLGGTDTLLNGVDSLLTGVVQFGPSLKNLSGGSGEINKGLKGLSTNGKEISGRLEQLNKGYNELAAKRDELSNLAQSLAASSTDPAVLALAQGVLAEKEEMNELNTNLSKMASGTKEYVDVVSTLSTKYASFHSGLQQLSDGVTPLVEGSQKTIAGLDEYKSGANDIGKGISELDKGLEILPDQVGKLVNGQKEFKDGIHEASTTIADELSDFTENEDISFPSFVNTDKQKVNSLQFILKTPGINKVNEDVHTEEVTESKTFWDKFLDLFR